MKTHHVCYEGTLACSGCNMCTHCFEVVNREVLAQAMRRTTEVIANARGSQGVVAVSELDPQNFWAVFHSFYLEAWKQLHVAMLNDPKVAERAYDLRIIPGFTETGRYVPPVLAPLAPPPAVPAPAVALSTLAAASASFVPAPVQPAPVQPAPLSTLAASVQHAPTSVLSVPFTLREEPASPSSEAAEIGEAFAGGRVERFASGDTLHLQIDENAEPKLVVGPADIRREITADDIAASATVLEATVVSTSNGVVAAIAAVRD